ncbi:hypothetical protein A3B02_00275 [Candidatus Roizmanbacteria bacterium RIFCSPLOWO2_01_FULL_42_14]|uniref:Bacterial Ig-like domain-containing protein n=4 Tax=Candidatus Roizmaniibacteriota TaxID=1752723 RepID=A0A1F7K1B3_9BACT|nr:MAG: hypothetical protein A3D08_01080 [Candidatus Roizmanbacteria bacterium RIFCSPHIGHO2_02_FULL_43_11]OGK38237.1 MAG: hypothetical protein A3F32_00530 [Candidatus Roizmanbacteria bacterium RIFCSPHIGHO2_12_FULL_42_10]OGK51442.1 MAG: hypothetical protein A3B02_00275 [Candidatus Roizmanbacteria bacterium RIFCSPLOWO2_01_FULL_42_14]OGK61645.1 MAG: hypothetical protein A3I56_05000 [Candidatus Roizmanbacteria bacterium RIFCSPLOWO2_02_FULL_43_10]
MYYARYYSRAKRIPGIVLIGITIVVMGTVIAVFRGMPSPKPQKQVKLERIDVVNVRDRSLTIFWRTKEPTQGYIIYGASQTKLDNTAFDERDSLGGLSKQRNHVVQIKGVSPNQTLYFKVYVDGTTVGQSQNVAYTAQTTRPLTSSVDLEPVYGDLVRQNGQPEKDAVVIVQIGASIPLLARTSDKGTFLFSLCCLINSQNQESLLPADKTGIRIHMIAEDGTEKTEEGVFRDMYPLTQALVIDNQVAQLQPISDQKDVPAVLAVTDSVPKLEPIDIIFPKNGASIPGSRPLVRGVGEAHEIVKGRFPKDGRIFQVNIDDKRNWFYQPSFDLTSGEHTLTVQTGDTQGNVVTLTRAFTILKSGEAVLGEATASGTVTPTASPSATPTLGPTAPETATATPTPPVSGINVLPITLVSLVLIVIGAGIILLF